MQRQKDAGYEKGGSVKSSNNDTNWFKQNTNIGNRNRMDYLSTDLAKNVADILGFSESGDTSWSESIGPSAKHHLLARILRNPAISKSAHARSGPSKKETFQRQQDEIRPEFTKKFLKELKRIEESPNPKTTMAKGGSVKSSKQELRYYQNPKTMEEYNNRVIRQLAGDKHTPGMTYEQADSIHRKSVEDARRQRPKVLTYKEKMAKRRQERAKRVKRIPQRGPQAYPKMEKGGEVAKHDPGVTGKAKQAKTERTFKDTLMDIAIAERMADRAFLQGVKAPDRVEVAIDREHGGSVSQTIGDPVAIRQAGNSHYKAGE